METAITSIIPSLQSRLNLFPSLIFLINIKASLIRLTSDFLFCTASSRLSSNSAVRRPRLLPRRLDDPALHGRLTAAGYVLLSAEALAAETRLTIGIEELSPDGVWFGSDQGLRRSLGGGGTSI